MWQLWLKRKEGGDMVHIRPVPDQQGKMIAWYEAPLRSAAKMYQEVCSSPSRSHINPCCDIHLSSPVWNLLISAVLPQVICSNEIRGSRENSPSCRRGRMFLWQTLRSALKTGSLLVFTEPQPRSTSSSPSPSEWYVDCNLAVLCLVEIYIRAKPHASISAM